MNEPVEYALITNESHWQEDPGCQEAHDHAWCEQPSYALSVSPVSIHRTRREFYDGYERVSAKDCIYGVEDVPVGANAYVVVCAYIDGDTFGYSGYWTVAGLFADAERAEDVRKRCEGENDTDRMFRPWDGYFASLRSAEVYPLTVLA